MGVVIIGTLQPFNAQLRNLPGVGHKGDDGTPGRLRFAWEVLHKGLGYIAVLLGIVNVVIGIPYAVSLSFKGGLVIFATTFAALSLGTQIIAGFGCEVYHCANLAKKITDDQEMEGAVTSEDTADVEGGIEGKAA